MRYNWWFLTIGLHTGLVPSGIKPLPALMLTHWGRVTHKCVSKRIINGSDNGLSPGRRQAIIWTNAGILLIGPLGTNFSEIWIKIDIFSFKKMHLKISSGKWRPSCLASKCWGKLTMPYPTTRPQYVNTQGQVTCILMGQWAGSPLD